MTTRIRRVRAAAALAVTLLAGSLTASAFGPGSAAAATRTAARAHPSDGRIVFDQGNTGQIYTINPDGTALVQVTHLLPGQFAIQPVWFPDASHIVFATNPGGGDFRIFVMRRNGTHMHQLAAEQHGFNDFTPTVTPDGHTVIFSRCRPDPPGGCALFKVRANGTARHALTRYRRGIDQPSDFWADVSPNGTQVAFNRFDSRGIASQVWLIGINGTDPHPITRPRLEAGVPRWTPNGRHLLVTSNFVHLGDQIYRITPNGAGLEQLTHTGFPYNNAVASPAPSGQRIAFVSDRAYPQPLSGSDLFVMRPNGHGQHSIATGNIFASDWGTAPLLSNSVATPRAQLAPVRPARQVRALQRLIDR